MGINAKMIMTCQFCCPKVKITLWLESVREIYLLVLVALCMVLHLYNTAATYVNLATYAGLAKETLEGLDDGLCRV
jgi:hypothetical protein